MRRPPGDPRKRLIDPPMVARSLFQGGAAFAVLAAIFLVGAGRRLAEPELRTLIFFALVAAIVALIFANRTFGTSIVHALLRGNRSLRLVLAFVALGWAIVQFTPSVQRVLRFVALPPFELGLVALTGALLLALFEWAKKVQGAPGRAD